MHIDDSPRMSCTTRASRISSAVATIWCWSLRVRGRSVWKQHVALVSCLWKTAEHARTMTHGIRIDHFLLLWGNGAGITSDVSRNKKEPVSCKNHHH
jgi:hypothetical protein